MSRLGSLYIELGEPEDELCGCTCEVGDWAADEIRRLRAELEKYRGQVNQYGEHTAADALTPEITEAPISTATIEHKEPPVGTVTIDDTEIPVRAYMHPSAQPHGAMAYNNLRKLVTWNDVTDQADWMEKGVTKWHTRALELEEKVRNLQTVLDTCASEAELAQQATALPQAEMHCQRIIVTVRNAKIALKA